MLNMKKISNKCRVDRRYTYALNTHLIIRKAIYVIGGFKGGGVTGMTSQPPPLKRLVP